MKGGDILQDFLQPPDVAGNGMAVMVASRHKYAQALALGSRRKGIPPRPFHMTPKVQENVSKVITARGLEYLRALSQGGPHG